MSESISLQVLTATTSFVEYTKTSSSITWRAVASSGFRSSDDGAVNFVEELNREPIFVQLDVTSLGQEPEPENAASPYCLYDLQLLLTRLGKKTPSVLEKLRELFGDEIKVSVFLKRCWSSAVRFITEISAEQMEIKGGKCCRRLVMRYHSFVYSETDTWEMTIKIYIPLDSQNDGNGNKLSLFQLDEPEISQTILNEELFTDLIISAGNGAKTKGHRAFLSAASPVLRATFKNKMKESFTGVLDMTDMSEKGVRALLRYIYSKDISGPKADVEVAFELLCAAHKYHVPKLEAMMVTQLMESEEKDFGLELAFRMHSFVRVWGPNSDLKSRIIEILKAKWSDVDMSPAYRKRFKDNPDSLFEFCTDLIEESASTSPRKARFLKNDSPVAAACPKEAEVKKKVNCRCSIQ